MKGFRPPKPTGSTPKARFDIWVYETLIRLNFIDSATVKFNERTTGISADAVVKASGGAPSTPSVAIAPFQYIANYKDYIIGKNMLTNTITAVAKPFEHRNSNTTYMDDGNQWQLAYPQNTQSGTPLVWNALAFVSRTKTFNGYTENQRISPEWQANVTIFYAIQVSFNLGINTSTSDGHSTSVAPVTWLSFSDGGRAWGATPDGNP